LEVVISHRLILLMILSCVFGTQADAKNIALLVGGAGEEFEKENFFEKDFNRFKNTLEIRGWEVRILFGGGIHTMPNSKGASNENIDQEIKKLSKEAKEGDSVILFVHSHGKKRKLSLRSFDKQEQFEYEKNEQLTHSIITASPDGYDLDKFQIISDQLTERGVYVALIDLSCYSGSTQNRYKIREQINKKFSNNSVEDKSPKYCAVTLASENYVSICSVPETNTGFTSFLTDLPGPDVDVSLEAHYLKARVADTSGVNIPDISTIENPFKRAFDDMLVRLDPSGHESFDSLTTFIPADFMPKSWILNKSLKIGEARSQFEFDLTMGLNEFTLQQQNELSPVFQNMNVALAQLIQSKDELNRLILENILAIQELSNGIGEDNILRSENYVSTVKHMLAILDSEVDYHIVSRLSTEINAIEQFEKDRIQYEAFIDQYNQSVDLTLPSLNITNNAVYKMSQAVIAEERAAYTLIHGFTSSDMYNPCNTFQL
jgi:hypothetical protein